MHWGKHIFQVILISFIPVDGGICLQMWGRYSPHLSGQEELWGQLHPATGGEEGEGGGRRESGVTAMAQLSKRVDFTIESTGQSWNQWKLYMSATNGRIFYLKQMGLSQSLHNLKKGWQWIEYDLKWPKKEHDLKILKDLPQILHLR